MIDFNQRRQDLTRRIVERIASDPKFRQAMATDPPRALADAGFNDEINSLSAAARSGNIGGPVMFLDSWGCAKV